jgi:SHS2 domain-containing protein
MGAPTGLSPRRPFDIEAVGIDREDLMVRVLSELLAAFELEGRFVTGATCVEAGIRTRGDWHVRLRCEGGRVDHDREPGLAAIKAVTYHGLSLREEAPGYRARVFVDV